MHPFKYATALTGGIATGKSTAAGIFYTMGIKIIDTDKIAHTLLDQQSSCIVAMFGPQCINRDKVDRKVLSKIVFGDQNKMRSLEKLLHPLIYEEVLKQSNNLDRLQKPYLIDIPLFFEKRSYSIDRSILIYASKTMQIQRLIHRENYTQKEAQIRIDSQIDIESKKDMATHVIDNTKSIKHLEQECKRVLKLI